MNPIGGQFYKNGGDRISDTKARELVRAGEAIEVPNARSGDYKAIAARLGYTKIEVDNWTSSAGDWSFRLRGGLMMRQTNRYPYFGFSYTIGRAE